ncbi:MAG: hypoxanthine phosphoribosyltransferase [Tissierellia bacterium]|nr:hypoxanthine phosphoribosyltransferase [Tissierellia bacterium]
MDKKEQILFSADEISHRVQELGEELQREYQDRDLVVIALLRGAFVFAADLVRAMDTKLEVDFLTTASYGNREETSGCVEFLTKLRSIITDRDVLIVDDIMDSGHTLKCVVEKLEEQNPKSIKTCVLLNKPSRREVKIEPDYIGFTIDDLFVVGYGLNYGNYCRNIPYIYTYTKE